MPANQPRVDNLAACGRGRGNSALGAFAGGDQLKAHLECACGFVSPAPEFVYAI